MTDFQPDFAVVRAQRTHEALRLDNGATLYAQVEPRERWLLLANSPEGVEILAAADTEREATEAADRVRAALALLDAEAEGRA